MNKINIWGKLVPYNTGDMKLQDMIVKKYPELVLLLKMGIDTFGTRIVKDKRTFDTFTYRKGIMPGSEAFTYDDLPTIMPFVVAGSDVAVIIAPGGGFFYKEIDSEGYHRAKILNSMGISAFVLDYRINPYKAPVPYLDMQRAIKYVRFHASEFGVDSRKVGVMGSSAGGYVAAASALLLADEVPKVEGYTPDEIDKESGKASFISLFYPVTGFYKNPSMLSILAGDDFFDDKKRAGLQSQYSLQNHLKGKIPPVFLIYGAKDPLKDMLDFDREMKAKNLDIETHVIPKVSHGFSPIKEPERDKLWTGDYKNWINRVTNSI